VTSSGRHAGDRRHPPSPHGGDVGGSDIGSAVGGGDVGRGRRRVRVLVAVAAVALGGATLGACSSSASTTSTTGVSTTTAKASTTTTSASTTTTGAATTTTAAGLARCATTALTGTVVGSSGAAGTIETTVALKSTSATPCVLGGFPGLQMLGATGASIPTTVVRTGNYSFTAMAPTTVTVAPGQAVVFNIGYSDVPSGSETSCPTSASLEVTPPNATDQLVMSAQLGPCDNGTLVVSPVFSPTGSASQTTAPPSS
jgi:hypothetical protein